MTGHEVHVNRQHLSDIHNKTRNCTAVARVYCHSLFYGQQF